MLSNAMSYRYPIIFNILLISLTILPLFLSEITVKCLMFA